MIDLTFVSFVSFVSFVVKKHFNLIGHCLSYSDYQKAYQIIIVRNKLVDDHDRVRFS